MTNDRVAIYARVSTADQNPEVQVLELREYAERRGWTIAEVFVDHGFSGARERRPALDRLMKDARRRCFDTVAVWKFDRFARSTRHLVLALDEFRALDVAFVSVTEAVDTSTPLGRAMFTIVGAIAEFERELTRERVRAGLAKAKASGKTLGRPRKEIRPERVHCLRRQGLSLRKIAAHLGVNKGVIARVLAEHPCPENPTA